ncbi:LysR substrate-binding domain-containing protein [Pseudomonas putida]|uniref:LysR substrate-binding domain-containing protein n=1 Tax=Pseudomonas putida TaxID=303 RepID=UPI00236446EE|nr:LysR substrate-binding domain-containing protein [Pseudomonas putida]MDD2068586.1 LysR substrate-binding domain-containing protein [Pseudomonas putida]HDS1738521.1 LysR family transcriptional regulator [Pseudomonas putida]
MQFRHLKTFMEVVRQGGFTQASKVLQLTQSAVSKQVSQLEKDLGYALLERTVGRVLLTPAGQVAYRRGEQMLTIRAGLQSDLDELEGQCKGELHLGLPQAGCDALFGELLSEYRLRYPYVAIRLLEGTSRGVGDALQAGQIEIGVGSSSARASFDSQPFCDEPVEVLMCDSDSLASATTLSLNQLSNHPFLLHQPGWCLNDRILQACAQEGFAPHVGCSSAQLDFLITLAAAGQGVLILPRGMARAVQRPGIVRLPLISSIDLRWQLAFMWRRSACLTTPARAWLALAHELSSVPQNTVMS